jgi:hypothetical protein
MPIFNVSFLNPSLRGKTGGGSGYSILGDQLSILESALKGDGVLTGGDYDMLISKAQEIMNNPGLTKTERSSMSTKIAAYESNKKVAGLQRNEDLTTMRNNLQNETSEDVMTVGSDPIKFLTGRLASMQAHLADLQEAIDRRSQVGEDVTQHMMEYNQSLGDFQQNALALEAAKAHTDANTPIPGYAAFVKTNARGEIIDVSYAPSGSKSGFTETTGMINGFQVFGQPNVKSNGESKFILGSDIYSGVDYVMDPTTGMSKPGKLYAASQQSGNAMFKKGNEGYINYTPEQLTSQGAILRGDWAKATDGTVYYRRPDGGYDKHVNAGADMPGRPPLDSMLTLPSILRNALDRYADKTVDDSLPVTPQGMTEQAPPMSMAFPAAIAQGGIPAGPMSREAQSVASGPMSREAPALARTSKPVIRAPQDAAGIADRTRQSGVDLTQSTMA